MVERIKDSVVRFLFEESAVRGVLVFLDESVSEINLLHDSSCEAGCLLGESLAAAVLLSRTIKLQGRLAIQARGDGALKLLVAESTHDAFIRGVVNLEDIGQQSVSSFKDLVGSGYLAVTLLPDEGESYQGVVPLEGRRLQDCLADYFGLSEQLPTALWLASDGQRAAGLMLQAMPAADEASSDNWQHLHVLANTVTNDELLSLSCDVLLHRLFHQEEVRVFEAEPVRFQCTCSAERSRSALAVLGRDDLNKLFSEQPFVTVDCQFCGAQYQYCENDMRDILGNPPTQLH